ncbi:MAG: DNA-formamidopyrimidine glycosylase family protein [Geminicoccaceae bacterium]|nr:DNA-formamidopyrimidine glycosylase family protein [Geminicoccaceae bacterium]
MPELPDVELYLHALRPRVVGRRIEQVRIASPSLVKTAKPSVRDVPGREVLSVRRIGKRIVIGLDGDLWLVLHLMINGRLHWREAGAKLARKLAHGAFDFAGGSLVLTEFGAKKRASLHLVAGEAGLIAHDPGGLEVLDAGLERFTRALRATNHTLKRALTDPRIFSGIGNAYSDEILHAARLSPLAMTAKLDDAEVRRLYDAARGTLTLWRDRLIEQTGDAWPAKVTAFRPEMAAHGKYGEACPACGTTIQRIRYADNETNYCPRCQTEGKVLADRGLSRLLGKDWPKTIEELELLRPPERRAQSPIMSSRVK